MKVEATIASIADDHVVLSFAAVAEAAGEIDETGLRSSCRGRHNTRAMVGLSCTTEAVAETVELATAGAATHATYRRLSIADSSDQGCREVLVDGVAEQA